MRGVSQKKVSVAELWEETYNSASHKPCSLETAKKQNHREGEINTTCIRGYYATTQVRYDPGNIAKNSYGKEALSYAQ